MNDEALKIFNIPIPKSRKTWTMGKSSWRYRRLLALSKLSPGKQALKIVCDEHGSKVEIKMLHSLAYNYGFRVACRPTSDGAILVWVKKPGFDKRVLEIWEHDT